MKYNPTDPIRHLESESIFIIREAFAQFNNPCILFSGGKDSISLVHLARLAFAPHPIPIPLLHIDTGHNFKEVLDFRDQFGKQLQLTIHVRKVEDTIKRHGLKDAGGKFPSRNTLQTHTLLETIQEFGFDACLGGARRDEEKARAKERIFSIRDQSGGWQPEKQRPELWNIFNGELNKDENMRVFPISNWTEQDVWQFILQNNITLPSIYYSHNRKCVITPSGHLLAVSDYIHLEKEDTVVEKNVRYRTVGDMTCTAAIESTAANPQEVIAELEQTNISERGQTRIDDRISDTGMEDRKRGGYF